jgi:AraC-like DNA-binding protein
MVVQGNNFGNEMVFTYRMHDRDSYTYPLHVHQFVELIFVIEGDLPITVDGRSQTVHSGECAMILPFQTHKFSSKSHVKMGMYLFSPSILSDFFAAHDGMVGSGACFTPSSATQQVYRDRIMESQNLSFYSVKSFIYLALNDYLSENEMVMKSSNGNVAARVGTYLNEHFDEQITLGTVADALGYSSNYLSHCIKDTFGMNFCSFLASLRIDKARRLLATTAMSSIEISFECGFGSERSFHRQFKLITGKTPLEYRAQFACKISDPGTVKYGPAN